MIKHFLSNYLSYIPFSNIHLSRRAILKFQYCFESYLYGQWRPREHCFIALLLQIVSLHQMCPTQMLIHYNFSAEWAIQSFMSPLCILFTDGTYETHLAYNVFSKWMWGGGDFAERVSFHHKISIWDQNVNRILIQGSRENKKHCNSKLFLMAELQMESDRCEIEEQGDEVAENSHNWKQFRWCCTFAQFFASI